jgi:uncharacterized membrane protein
MVREFMKRIPWIVFALMLPFAIGYLILTASSLPPLVASHFNGAGYPTAYMTRRFYTQFVLALGVGLPVAMVVLFTVVFSSAQDMRLPNRGYWLAPERIARTRAVLISFGVGMGSLLVAMVCYIHWLQLGAHRSVPPHVSNRLVLGGLLVFSLITIGIIVAMLGAFRLPRDQR